MIVWRSLFLVIDVRWRARLVSAASMASMPAMTSAAPVPAVPEDVHGEEQDKDHDPKPVL